jgi:hypothetical protein
MNGIRRWLGCSLPERITPSEILSFGLNLLKEVIQADLRSLPDSIVVLDGENEHDFFCAYVPPPAAKDLNDKDFVERGFPPNCTDQVELFLDFCAQHEFSIEQRSAALWALRAAAYTMPFVLDGWQVGRCVMADGGLTIRTFGLNSRVDSSS